MTADEPVEDPHLSTAVRRCGPLLLWRGRVHTPRPWPRLLFVERIGWCFLLQTDAYGMQWIGRRRPSPSVPVESREQPKDEVASMCGTGDLQPMSDPYRRPPPIVPSPPFVSDEAHWAEVMGRFTTLPDLVRAARALAYQALAESRDTIRELQAEAEQRRRYIAQVHSANRTMTALNDELAAERDRARDIAAHLEEQLARMEQR